METTVVKRIVKVYSTSTGLKMIESSAKTWGELKSDLYNNNIAYSSMNAVENVNNSSLILDEAKLPEGEFVLMLTPQKTKSGNDYKTIRAEVVDAINTFGQKAKDHFNSGGKNYTNKSKEELAELLKKWKAKNGTVTSTTPTVTPVKVEPAKKKEEPEVAQKPLKVEQSFYGLWELMLQTSEAKKNPEGFAAAYIAMTTIPKPVPTISPEEQRWIDQMKNKL